MGCSRPSRDLATTARVPPGSVPRWTTSWSWAAVVGRSGGVVDDALRLGRNGKGLGLGDDVLRSGRLPVWQLGDEVSLGQGRLAKVSGEVAPGAGHSVEEALVDIGVDIALEVVGFDDGFDPQGDSWDDGSRESSDRPVVVALTDPDRDEKLWRNAQPGALIVVAGERSSADTITLSKTPQTDSQIHHQCMDAGARCVLVTCAPGDGCSPLANGISRMAAAKVADGGTLSARHAQLVYSIVRQQARVRANDITVSRSSANEAKIVRVRLGSGRE